MRLEVADGRLFVRAHERAVAGDVGGEDGSQSTARCGHSCGVPDQR